MTPNDSLHNNDLKVRESLEGELLVMEILKPSYNSLSKITRLLQSKKVDPNKDYVYGNNAVHHAAKKGKKRVLELLVKAGGNCLKTNHSGQSALMIASRGTKRKHSLCVEYLLKLNHSNIDAIDHEGRTSLRQAILAANVRSVELLLFYGCAMSWEEHRLLYSNDHSQPMALKMTRQLNKDVGMLRKVFNPYEKILSLLTSKIEGDEKNDEKNDEHKDFNDEIVDSECAEKV